MKATRIVASVAGASITFTALSMIAIVNVGASHNQRTHVPMVWAVPSALPAPDSSGPVVRAALASPQESSSAVTAAAAPVQRQTLRPAPIYSRISIKQRAVFITIDDGITRDPRVLALIQRTHVPISAFLVNAAVNHGVGFWQAMSRAGVHIEDHTLTHPRMTKLTYANQRRQICLTANHYRQLFGQAPPLFRPPYGSFDARTLKAVSECGLSAAVNWSATMGGGTLRTWSGGKLRPGDIILMHFKPGLYDDLAKLLRILRSERYGVGVLEDYLVKRKPSKPASAAPSVHPVEATPAERNQ